MNIKRLFLLTVPTFAGLTLLWWLNRGKTKAEPVTEAAPKPTDDIESLAADPEKRRAFMRAMGKMGGKKPKKGKEPVSENPAA